jgi:formylglycine-generating enzyme required for sulfatase activity
LKHIATPGLDIRWALGRVRDEVMETTRPRQEPFVYGSLGGRTISIVDPPAGSVAGPPIGASPSSTEAAQAWAIVKDITDIRAVEAFRRQYGAANTFYDRLAEARIDELKRAQLAVATPPPAPSSPPPVITKPAAIIVSPAQQRCDGVEAEVGGERRCLRPKDSFKDCSDCPEMVVIPAGEFVMGSTDDDHEKPLHKVTIARPFAVGKFTVTFAEWDACMAGGGCKRKLEDQGWGRDKRPVINVSWYDAIDEYLPWLSRRTGKAYRLLSEAEWEYAARAGSSRNYPWGDEIGRNRANCLGCGSQWAGKGQTAPVGSFEANAFGLHDMHGNVFQWVQDNWHPNYKGAPTDGSVWSGGSGEQSAVRVLRGGSWVNGAWILRSANRYRNDPMFRYNSFSFRVARTL